MEKCYGCGGEAEKHPVLGIINKADVKAGAVTISNPQTDSQFVGVVVCKKCHENPEHRTANALKCHFHMRDDAKKALVGLIMAGSNDLHT